MYECDSDQCPQWSISYDACPDSEQLGFNPPLRHILFQIVSLILPTVIFGDQYDLQV